MTNSSDIDTQEIVVAMMSNRDRLGDLIFIRLYLDISPYGPRVSVRSISIKRCGIQRCKPTISASVF